MLRDDWKTLISKVQVLEAAKNKAEWRTQRIAFWKNRQEETLEKVKADGLTVTEELYSYSTSNAGNFNPQIAIKPELKKDLEECQRKIKEHQSALEKYIEWIAFLSIPDATVIGEPVFSELLSLDISDYTYFFCNG